MRRPSQIADIHFIRQKEPKGLGHAIWCARKFIGDEPFAVLLGDDIVVSEKPCLKQLIETYDHYQVSVLGVQPVPIETVNRYGIVDGIYMDERVTRVQRLVEKPDVQKAPSNIAILGRYILTPRIFSILENQGAGAGGEIQLTDAIATLNRIEAVYAYEFEGKRYDVGEKLGFIQTVLDFALNRPEIRDELLTYIKGIVSSEAIVNE